MTWLKDTAERVAVTFVQAWLAGWLILTDKGFDNLFTEDSLLIGVVAAVGALLKALAARQTGDSDSASLIE